MRYSLLFSLLFLFLLSCNKNKFSTTPTLKFKSVNTTTLHRGETITFRLTFTDAEGDLTGDSALFVQEKVLNCNNSGSGFKQPYPLPSFPTTKNQDGEIVVSYGYDVNSGQNLKDPKCSKNDTAVFKFALRDKGGHVSDTVVTDKVVVIF